MHAKNMENRSLRTYLKPLLIAFLLGLSASLVAQGTAEDSAMEPKASLPEAVPDLVELPDDWLANITAIEPDADMVRDRFEQVVVMVERRIAGLDEENRLTAESALQDLRNNVSALVASLDEKPPEPDVVIPSQDRYTLDEVLKLNDLARTIADRQGRLEASLEQASRQYRALEERRVRLVEEYGQADPTTPGRIISGIRRMAVGIELQAYSRSNTRMAQEIALLEGIRSEILQTLEYARKNMHTGETMLADYDRAIAQADRALAETGNERSAVQNHLVESRLEDSFRLLRLKQELTQVSALESRLALTRELEYLKRIWHRVASGDGEAASEYGDIVADSQQLMEQTRELSDVWSRASQATLTTPAPETNDRTQVDDYTRALDAARESIGIIHQICDTIDDMQLVETILETRIYELGLASPQVRARALSERFWSAARKVSGLKLFSIGDTSVTVGRVIQFVVIIVIGFILSWFVRRMLSRVQKRKEMAVGSASFYTAGRILHYVIMSVAVLAAFSALGLDTGSLALIAGALSVGIGFGLQSIVNNFMSGLILLFEGSLRVGDFVELDSGVTGTVREISTRYTRINTNDNIDVVVPNSELVSYRLKNWTLREPVVRVRIPFGVAYGSDKERVRQAALEAAADVPYTIGGEGGREPVVLLTGFGESSLAFEMRVWIRRSGVARPGRVRATYYWALETRLGEHGIEIPFPQRDVHIMGNGL